MHTCLEHETHVLLSCAAQYPALIVCDHASNHIPESYNGLGMDAASMREHIAWDIGAGEVSRQVGAALGAPVVLAATSRLLVDCNRRLDDPTAFPAVSDGAPVAGNQDLEAAEREQRANTYYWPYHHAIRDQLRELEQQAAAPAVIAIHSFTPELSGFRRPWHIGALWDKDSRIALPFMEALRTSGGIVVGDNEPYSGRHPADFTLDHHAEAEGLPHLGIEVRQDLIDNPEGVQRWADILVSALRPILADDALYTLRAGQV